MSPARPRLSEEQEQQRELAARRALEQLMEDLLDAASDAGQDQRLWGSGDRARFLGRGTDLVVTVDRRLKEISKHLDTGVRADQLIDLHDMLFAAAFIGGCLKTPTVRRLRTIAAKGAKLAGGHRRDEVLVEAARAILRKPGHSTWKHWRVAGDGDFNELLETRGLRKMKRDTIDGHLSRLWPRIMSSTED
jgi:hypothetical protein